ncbi:MAG: response regulator [Treponema sp.]|jgi:signal transduction histidine kinase/CheY-like chemotaxis protein/HPt (histidine-containing phosphotransfer) domain-containing protein|nr:response regulator [Treponema sp.]
MKWFENIKIRNKLFIVFGMLVFIMISFSVFAVARIISMGSHYNELITIHQVRQIHIADAIADAYGLRVVNLSRGYLLEDDHFRDLIVRMLENYQENADSFMENLNGYRSNMLSDPSYTEAEKQERLAIVNGIEDIFNGYLEITIRLENAVENNDKAEVISIFNEAIPAGTELIDKLQDFRNLVFYTARLKAAQTMDSTANTIVIIVIMTAAFILISTLVLLFTVSSLNRPFVKLEKAVAEIARGNLAYPVRDTRRDELGKLSNCIGDMVDKVSEHNKTMAVMDILDSMINVVDLDYNLLYMNRHMADTFDLDREKCLGQKCYKVTKHKDSPCEFCQLPELLPDKDSFPSKEFEYLWDDALGIWVGGTASIIRWIDGSIAFFRASRDETDKKEQDIKLEEALETAKAASATKSSFLANMSHEIRTPMNAILGVTEILLRDENHRQSTVEGLQRIYHSGDLLLNIINDILDLSKIEAGKLELVYSNYEIASTINDTVTLNMMRIGSKPIEFELSVNENLPSVLHGDELRIKQILNNLLSNAFKYTKEGRVKLSISFEGHPQDNEEVTLVFAVSDTGQGMSEEQVSKLFDEYSRFNVEANRTTEGTGLGMSITKNLLFMMNGDIDVTSEMGKGSVFTVWMPQKCVGSETLGKELAENLEKFRATGDGSPFKKAQIVCEPMPYGKVLVVDDVESNLFVAQGLMRPYELSVETAGSGFAAIDKIKDGNVYDIVFMDHMMPKMDGIETVKKIREWGYLQPIVALTANAVVGQSDVFLANGFDGFVSKPIDLRQLNAALRKFVRDKQPPEVIAAVSAARKGDQQIGAASQQASLQAAEVSETWKKIEQIDGLSVQTGLERLMGQRDIYEKALKLLLKEIDKCDRNLKEFLSVNDMHNFAIEVHGMKGSLANVGAMEISALAKELEMASKAVDADFCATNLPPFLDRLGNFKASLVDAFAEEKQNQGPVEIPPELPPILEKIKAAISNEETDYVAIDEGLEDLDKLNAGALKEDIDQIKEAVAMLDYENAMEMMRRLAI